MTEFKKLGLGKQLVSVLESIRINTPTEIQEKTIPLILEGKDVIGNAATGSGKTLAFAAGIIEKCVPGEGIQALVLTPTRELAEQITKVIREFSKGKDLRIEEVYGGVGYERQIDKAKKADVIIATPGRLLDHLNKKTIDFFPLKILVLDEADRMVDMGFLPDVEKIIRQCPMKRQTMLFSATISPDVEYIEKKYMISPKSISVKKYVDASKLEQYFYDVPGHLKFSLLVHLLKGEKSGIVMVFCNTRRNVDRIVSNLRRYGINAQAIHGGLDQKKRSRVIEKFHQNEADILVCTDVAARGLDIKGVTHVYSYDTPSKSDEYIHRVGRTARAGENGMAISLISSRDYDNFRRVTNDPSLNIIAKELPKIEKLNVNFNDEGSGSGERNHRQGNFRRNSRGRNSRDQRRGGSRPHNRSSHRPGHSSSYSNRSRSSGSSYSNRSGSSGSSYSNRSGSSSRPSRPRHSNRSGSSGSSYSNRSGSSGHSRGQRTNTKFSKRS